MGHFPNWYTPRWALYVPPHLVLGTHSHAHLNTYVQSFSATLVQHQLLSSETWAEMETNRSTSSQTQPKIRETYKTLQPIPAYNMVNLKVPVGVSGKMLQTENSSGTKYCAKKTTPRCRPFHPIATTLTLLHPLPVYNLSPRSASCNKQPISTINKHQRTANQRRPLFSWRRPPRTLDLTPAFFVPVLPYERNDLPPSPAAKTTACAPR